MGDYGDESKLGVAIFGPAFMKIFVVASFAPSLLRFRGELLRTLVADGHSVVAVAPEADEGVLSQLRRLRVAFLPIPLDRSGFGPFSDLKYVIKLRGAISKELPDIVFAYTHKPVIYTALAAFAVRRRPRVFSLITGLGFAFVEGGGWKQRSARFFLEFLYRQAMRRISGVIFQNPDDRELFNKAGFIRTVTPQIVVRGSGVDLQYFPFVPVELGGMLSAEAARGGDDAAASGFMPQVGRVRFLLIARLLIDKGIREYEAAARVIKREYPLSEFYLVGPRDPNPAAISDREVARWRDEDILQYVGETDDVRAMLRSCAVYVLPSLYREGTPRSVLEAMATGRAVITTDAPGCRETIFGAAPQDATHLREGINGFLVPLKDVGALIAAMRRFLDDPLLASRMGAEGRRLAEAHYDVHKVNRQILEFMGLSGGTINAER